MIVSYSLRTENYNRTDDTLSRWLQTSSGNKFCHNVIKSFSTAPMHYYSVSQQLTTWTEKAPKDKWTVKKKHLQTRACSMTAVLSWLSCDLFINICLQLNENEPQLTLYRNYFFRLSWVTWNHRSGLGYVLGVLGSWPSWSRLALSSLFCFATMLDFDVFEPKKMDQAGPFSSVQTSNTSKSSIVAKQDKLHRARRVQLGHDPKTPKT